MNQIIENIDILIRSGKGAQARHELRKLLAQSVERAWRAPIANLCRRTGLTLQALRLLNPIVRPTGKRPEVPASPKELAEYAASLSFVGAAEEALTILKKVDVRTAPEALLFQAFGLFAQWDYPASIPVLKRYVLSPKISEYQRVVGKVNLLAALIDVRQSAEALPLLEELTREVKQGGYQLLYGNLLELRAQLFIFEHDWQTATKVLKEAKAVLKDSRGIAPFFVAKWEAIAEFLHHPSSKAAREILEPVRMMAGNHSQWETVRDCDRFEAITLRDTKLFSRLYYGTPFAQYRETISKEFGWEFPLPKEFVWRLGEGNNDAVRVDLLSAKREDRAESLKPGQLRHRMWLVLCQDFYRPARVAMAHHFLYPDDFFNPVSSPPRVYEAVRRLGEWFEKQAIPFVIDQQGGYYRLVAERPCEITISQKVIRPVAAKFFPLLNAAPQLGNTFDLNEVARVLKLPRRSAQRLLKSAKEARVVKGNGQARATRYSWVKRRA